MLVPVLLGAVLGGLFALVTNARTDRHRRHLLAAGLAVAAFIYVVLAVIGAPGGHWLAIELAGLGVFAGLAWLGSAVAPVWLAVGWTTHVAWDLGLHSAPAVAFVPPWYPALCVGFDLVVAGYALAFRPPRPAPQSRREAA